MDRIPPFSEEAEKAVLGAVLLDPTTVLDLCVQEKMSVDAFYVPAHSIIFAAMGTLLAKGRPVDYVSLSEHLRTKGDFERAGGQKGLDDLVDATPTAEHAEHYIAIVKEMWLKRKIIALCRRAESEAYTCDDPELLRGKAESAFSRLHKRIEVYDLDRIFDDMVEDIKRGLDGKPVEVGISTGYRDLDESCGGLRPKGVYWLTGKPKAGKTTLKDNIIFRNLVAGRAVADLTFEMSVRQEIEKLTSICIEAEIEGMIRGKKNAGFDRIQEARALLVESELLQVGDQTNVTNEVELVSWGRRMVDKHGVKLITVDYLQLLQVAHGGNMKIEEKTTKQADAIQHLASTAGVPVICVTAVNDDGKVRGSRMADYHGACQWIVTKEKDQKPRPPDYRENITVETRDVRYARLTPPIEMVIFGAIGKVIEKQKVEQKEFLDEYNSRTT